MNGTFYLSDAFGADAIAGLSSAVGRDRVGIERDADRSPIDDAAAGGPVAWRVTSFIAAAPSEPGVWQPPELSARFASTLACAARQSPVVISISDTALRDPAVAADATAEFDLQGAYARLSRLRFLIESFAVPVAVHLPSLQVGGRTELIADFLDEINSPYIGWGHELAVDKANIDTITRLRDELAHRVYVVYLRVSLLALNDAVRLSEIRAMLPSEVPLVLLPERDEISNLRNNGSA